MKNSPTNTECLCGQVYKGYPNFWGKICGRCGAFIPPIKRLPVVVKNEQKKKLIVKQIRVAIKKKFGLHGEEENANPK